MMSKWLDVATHAASFHMQCKHYDDIRPPTFFDHPELLQYNLSRDRIRRRRKTGISPNDLESALDRNINEIKNKRQKKLDKIKHKKEIELEATKRSTKAKEKTDDVLPDDDDDYSSTHYATMSGKPAQMFDYSDETRNLDGGWNLLYANKPDSNQRAAPQSSNGFYEMRYSTDPNRIGDTPSLFLQELAHLASLSVAVAFNTLRYDVDACVESPLGMHKPGYIPPPDSSKLKREERWAVGGFFSHIWGVLNTWGYWVGLLDHRGYEYRDYVDLAREMPVIGGVSDSEIAMLKRCVGASAKTNLAFYWVSEYLAREHLAGSTGPIGPPIISRLFQFLSDGMIYYNHARKIMYIPFPFAHAQLAAVFIHVASLIAVPLLMNQYANEPWIGSLLTYLTVSCLVSTHEVGRELEDPYKNYPNEIPLVSLMAMFNESLLTMCSGFHPDGFWKPSLPKYKHNPETPQTCSSESVYIGEMQEENVEEMNGESLESNSDKAFKSMQDTIDSQAQEIAELRKAVESLMQNSPTKSKLNTTF